MKSKIIGTSLFIVIFSLSFRFFLYIDVNIGHNWDWSFPSLNFFFDNLKNLSLFTWNPYNLGTVIDLTISHLIPNSIFSIVGQMAGIKLFLFLLFFLTTLISFYGFKRLLDFLSKESCLNYIPSLLYTFSPFLFNDIIGGSWVMWVSYAFCPLYFVFVLKYLKTNTIKYLLSSLLVSVFIIISLQHFVLINLFVSLYLIYEVAIFKSKEFRSLIIRTFVFLTLFILINIYWILPFSYTFVSFAKNMVLSDGGIHAFDPIRNSTQSIWNIFNLGGYLDRNMYLHSMPLALKFFFQVIVALAWLAIGGYFLLEKNKDKKQKATFWILLLLILIIIVKGGNSPFSGFTMWLYESFPLMKLYRSPQHLMFVPAFTIPILIAFSLNYFHEKFVYKKTVVIGFSFIVMIWINGWWYNGDLGHKTLMEQKRDFIDFYQLPPSLSKYYEIMHADTADYRSFFLPAVHSPSYLKTKYQNRASGFQPEYLYLDKPTFSSESNKFANNIEISFCKDNDFDYIKYLLLFSVKNIVLRSDIYPHHTESTRCWNNNRVKKILDSETAIESFLVGKYTVAYNIKDNYFLPHIYAASPPTLVVDNINSLIPLTYTSFFNKYPAFAFTEQQNKETLNALINLKLKNSTENELLFVNTSSKALDEQYKDKFSQMGLNYFFYVDRQKIEGQLKGKGELEDIKSRGINPFELGNQKFYISRDSKYSIRAILKPKRDFIKMGFVKTISTSASNSENSILGWDVRSLNPDLDPGSSNAIFKQNISKDGMYIEGLFQNRGNVQEGVMLNKTFNDINIEETPYLAFFYDMDNPNLQEMEINIKFTDPDSKNLFSRKKKVTLKTDQNQYIINLYKKFIDEFGKPVPENMMVKEVVMKFKKKYGEDFSKNKRKYEFLLKNIEFFERYPVFVDFSDSLRDYLPDKYYYFDKYGGLRNVDFIEQVPNGIADIYKLNTQEFVDLEETPVLSFKISMPLVMKKDFPAEWRMVLRLDFDGDEQEDERMEILVPASGIYNDNLMFSIRAYEEVKKMYSDKEKYNLISIGISHPKSKKILFQNVMTKKLIRYREYLFKPSDFEIGDSVLKVADKVITLPSIIKNKKDDSNSRFITANLFFKKGGYGLSAFENNKFKVEMVEIKKEDSGHKTVGSGKSSNIEFKKINPTKYIADVKGANGPFTLVFSESFHEGWKAYIRQSVVGSYKSDKTREIEPLSALWSAWKDRGNRLELKEHFVVNGYANGWIVPIKQKSEDFQIVLEFVPQRLFEAGLIVSAITLLGCIGYLGAGSRRQRKKGDGED
ncbi:MAG TPA: hypothetical protein ENH52_01975 [Nitrospirae bacterium]|nr:hypothetical protein [Nitrospirota bacterium]